MFRRNHKTDYEYWKMGERVFKAPWVIDYYKNITDFNQYLKAKKMHDIGTALMMSIGFVCGFWLGNIIWG